MAEEEEEEEEEEEAQGEEEAAGLGWSLQNTKARSFVGELERHIIHTAVSSKPPDMDRTCIGENACYPQ